MELRSEQVRFCDQKKKPEAKQIFASATSTNLMSASPEGAERLAEIFREIFALSETNRRNHSKSAMADDSLELFDTQCASGTPEGCAVKGKQAGAECSKAEDQQVPGQEQRGSCPLS